MFEVFLSQWYTFLIIVICSIRHESELLKMPINILHNYIRSLLNNILRPGYGHIIDLINVPDEA